IDVDETRKEFRAATDIEVLLLFNSAKLKSSSSEDVSVQGADLGIVGKGPAEADLRMREIHLVNSVTCGFSRSYSQPAQVPSSKVTCKSPRTPWINCRMVLALVSMMDSITSFPSPFITAIEMLSL